VLGALLLVLGACGLIGAVVLGLIFAGAAGAVGASGDPDAALAIPIIGLTGMALVGFIAVMALPGVVVGVGLLQLRPWARIGGIVLSVLQLLWFPLGTMLGIYGLWALPSAGSAPLFNRSRAVDVSTV